MLATPMTCLPAIATAFHKTCASDCLISLSQPISIVLPNLLIICVAVFPKNYSTTTTTITLTVQIAAFLVKVLLKGQEI
jgi:hypothetical protein